MYSFVLLSWDKILTKYWVSLKIGMESGCHGQSQNYFVTGVFGDRGF